MSDRAHTVCHVAKSGLCSHNLSFCVHKNNVELRKGQKLSFSVCMWGIERKGTVWQRMVLFYFPEIKKER